MKKAKFSRGYIDQIIAFMLVFVFFVFLLFLIIGYSNVSRIQYNLDTLTGILTRMISTGKSMSQVEAKINSFKLPIFQNVTTANITGSCSGNSNRVQFTITATYRAPILGSVNVVSSSTAYNEQNSSDCIYSLNLIQP